MTTVDTQLGLRNSRTESLSLWGGDSFSNASEREPLSEKLKAQVEVVDAAKKVWQEAVLVASEYRLNYQQGGYCAGLHKNNKSKRRRCQEAVNDQAGRLAYSAQLKKNTYDSQVLNLNQIKERIETNEEAIVELAAQGETPESIIAKTQSQIKEQEKADSQRRLIIYGVAAAALLIGGIIVVRKIK